MKIKMLPIYTAVFFLTSITAATATDLTANPFFTLLSTPQVDCFTRRLNLSPQTLSSLAAQSAQARCELFVEAINCLLAPSQLIAQLIARVGDRGRPNPGTEQAIAQIGKLFSPADPTLGLKGSCAAAAVGNDGQTSSTLATDPSVGPKAVTPDRDLDCC